MFPDFRLSVSAGYVVLFEALRPFFFGLVAWILFARSLFTISTIFFATNAAFRLALGFTFTVGLNRPMVISRETATAPESSA